MSLTNDIRRLRNKLKILDMEGSGQVMNELLNLRKNAKTGSNEDVIKFLKGLYKQELDDALSKQQKFKQGELKL